MWLLKYLWSVFGWEILNSKNFKYFNSNSFIFKILCLDKKKLKLWGWKKMNAKRKKNMVSVLLKRRILMCHGESHGNRDTMTYTIISDHNIKSTAQGMAQTFRTDEHLYRVIDNDNCSPDWHRSMCLPISAPDRCSAWAQTVFHEVENYRRKERFTSSRTRFQTQVNERMKMIKEIYKHFGIFSYQEENFNFSLLKKN